MAEEHSFSAIDSGRWPLRPSAADGEERKVSLPSVDNEVSRHPCFLGLFCHLHRLMAGAYLQTRTQSTLQLRNILFTQTKKVVGM